MNTRSNENGQSGELTNLLSEKASSRLLEQLRELRRSGPCYRFPWLDLERKLAQGTEFSLFGYGSLIDPISAAATILARSDEPILTIGFGVTRVFEYEMPEQVVRKHGHLYDPQAKAALNVRPSENVKAFANGVVIKVSAEDLPALRVREAGYDLIPVPCVPWSDWDAEPVIALTLACPVESTDGIRHVRSDLNPHGPYLENCLRAAARISDEFLAMFLRTTYIIVPGSKLEQLSPTEKRMSI